MATLFDHFEMNDHQDILAKGTTLSAASSMVIEENIVNTVTKTNDEYIIIQCKNYSENKNSIIDIDNTKLI